MPGLSDALPDDGIPDYGQKTAAGIVKGGLTGYLDAQKQRSGSIDAATNEMRAGNNTAAGAIGALPQIDGWGDFTKQMAQPGQGFMTSYGNAVGAYTDATRKEREFNLTKIDKLNALAQANAALTNNAGAMHWDLANDPITRAPQITAAGQAGGQAILPGLIQQFGTTPSPTSGPPPAAAPGPVSLNEPPPGDLTPPPPLPHPPTPAMGGAPAPSMPPPPVSPSDQLAGGPAPAAPSLGAAAQVAGPGVPTPPTRPVATPTPADASAALDPAHAQVLVAEQAKPGSQPPAAVAAATQAGLHAVAQQSTPDPATMGIKGMDDWAQKITTIARQHPGIIQVGNFAKMLTDAQKWLEVTPSKAGLEAREKMPSEVEGANQKAAFDKRYASHNTALEKAADEAANALQIKQQAQAAVGLMTNPDGTMQKTGPMGEDMARIGAALVQTGLVSSETIKKIMGLDPNDASALQKLTVDLGSEQARQGLPGSPIRVTEFNNYMKASPGLSLPGVAMKWLVENVINKKADAAIQRYDSVKHMDPGKDNVRASLFDFDKTHPWYVPGKTPPQTTSAAAAPTTSAAPPPVAQREVGKTTVTTPKGTFVWGQGGWQKAD